MGKKFNSTIEFFKKYGLAIFFVVAAFGTIAYFEVFSKINSSFNSKAVPDAISQYPEILEWQCSKTITVENYTVVTPKKDFVIEEFCDIKQVCDSQQHAEKFLGKKDPAYLECIGACKETFKEEIEAKKKLGEIKPYLKFYNTTYCIEEKAVLKDIKKDVSYEIKGE